MIFSSSICLLPWALLSTLADARYTHEVVPVQMRNAPGESDRDTTRWLRDFLGSNVEIEKRDSSSITLDRSFFNAALMSGTNQVTCTTCYIQGTVTASLASSPSFSTPNSTTVASQVQSVSTAILNSIFSFLNSTVASTITGSSTFGEAGAAFNQAMSVGNFPTVSGNFNLQLSGPEPAIKYQFTNGLEVYLQMDVKIPKGVSYTINLFTGTSSNPITAGSSSLTPTASLDLVLMASTDVDMSTGFHVKLEAGLAMEVPLFSEAVSSVTVDNGRFEFLPVSVNGSSANLRGVLRLGLQTGLEILPISQNLTFSLPGGAQLPQPINGSAGVVAGAFVNVADFTSDVTSSSSKLDCQLGYNLEVAGGAGISVQVSSHTWGPTPVSSVAIFTSTSSGACPTTAAAKARREADIEARDQVAARATTSSASASASNMFTATSCLSSLVNCPVSLQSTIVSPVTGNPGTTASSVASTIAFAANAKSMATLSGSPTAWTPPPTPTTSAGASGTGTAGSGSGSGSGLSGSGSSGSGSGGSSGSTGGSGDAAGGMSDSNKLAIGLGVGLGVPFLVAIVFAIWYFMSRRDHPKVSKRGAMKISGPYVERKATHKSMKSQASRDDFGQEWATMVPIVYGTPVQGGTPVPGYSNESSPKHPALR